MPKGILVKGAAEYWGFLLVTGYLKLVNVVPPLGEGALREVALPYQEIAFVI